MGLTLALGALLVASSAYYAAALAAIAGFRRRPPLEADATASGVGVSVLKPAVGAGDEFAEFLRSHAAQDHSDFEILVGTRPGDTDAREATRTVQAEFPESRIEIIECPEASRGCNGKVEVLERLAQRASKAVWVVTDADIRVPPRYLRTICAELSSPNMGLVTCLYRAEAGSGLASRLEGLRIDTEFPCEVLLARRLQGMRFALGATLAFRRETLARIGGFNSLRGFMGDDYILGARVASEGLRVEVSSIPVSTRSRRDDGLTQVWGRQLRWSRTIRKQRPAGHAGLVVTFAMGWCCLALLVQPETLWPLAVVSAASRLAAGVASASLVDATGTARNLWLLPLADIAASVTWIGSYFGNTVTWAGKPLKLGRGGQILG